jgi:hypothetical protein
MLNDCPTCTFDAIPGVSEETATAIDPRLGGVGPGACGAVSTMACELLRASIGSELLELLELLLDLLLGL